MRRVTGMWGRTRAMWHAACLGLALVCAVPGLAAAAPIAGMDQSGTGGAAAGTPGAAAEVKWVRCASEGQTCAFTGTRQVRYGANGTYAYRTATTSVECTNAVFGDPAYGADKFCDYADDGTTTPPPAGTWTRCALEDQVCAFTGTRQVRFGANGSYAYQTATGSIACTNAVFGDPAHGYVKSCSYSSVTK